MATTVLIYLAGSDAVPSADALGGFAHHFERSCLLENNGNQVSEAATIATGMLAINHELSTRKALAFDPLRLRPVCTTDSIYPWIWDLASSSGLRSAVVAWPGILDAADSPTPMVTELALIGKPNEAGEWPLFNCSVSSGVSSDAIASARVTPEGLDATLLPDPSLWKAQPDQNVNPTGLLMARSLSTLGALEVLAGDGLDLAVIGFSVPGSPEHATALGTHLLDLVLDRLPAILGSDLELLIVSSNRDACNITLAGSRPCKIPENFRIHVQDAAPTMLGMLGLEPPTLMRGHNMLLPTTSMSSELIFEVPQVTKNTDLDRLVEAFEAGELAALPDELNKELQSFARRKLGLRVVIGFQQRDFNYALKNAELIVRLHPVEQTLWTAAYAANRIGDLDRAGELSRRLLEAFPGTPAALLSSLLGSNSIPLEHKRVIIDSIEPASLTGATMRSLWGRTAILTERVDDGIEVLTRLIQERRHFPIDRFVLASAFHNRGDHQDALRVLGQLGSKPRADIEMRLLRGSILFSLNQHDACRELTEATLIHYPHEKRAMAIIRKLDQTN